MRLGALILGRFTGFDTGSSARWVVNCRWRLCALAVATYHRFQTDYRDTTPVVSGTACPPVLFGLAPGHNFQCRPTKKSGLELEVTYDAEVVAREDFDASTADNGDGGLLGADEPSGPRAQPNQGRGVDSDTRRT